MIIKRIYIREFAGITDTEIILNDGLNVIRGDNESGKSSVIGFIRFIYFGLPPMKGADNIAERERSLSWTTGAASGFLEIDDNGSLYRLERSYVASGLESSRIIDLKTGAQVFRGEEIRRRFPGVPAAVYDSVCCVKQQKIAALDGEAIKTSIENLLMSGDEAINTGLALRRLDKVRKELMLKKGQGGLISELEKRETEISERLENAKQNSGRMISLQASVEKYRGIALDCRRELENAGNRLHACESCIKLERFDALHGLERQTEELKKAEADYIAAKGRDGKLPDGDYINRLGSLSRKLGACDSDVEVAKAHVSEANAGKKGDAVAAARSEDIGKAGGADEIIKSYRKTAGKRSRMAVISAVLCAVGLAAAVLPVVFTFLMTKYLPSWMSPGAAFAVSAAGIIMLAVGIALIPAAAKKGKKAEKYLRSFGFDEKIRRRTVEKDFALFVSECNDAYDMNLSRQRQISEACEELRAAESGMDDIKKTCAELLGEFTDDEIPSGTDELEAYILGKADEFASYSAEYGELHAKSVMTEERLKLLREELADEDEASLRSHLLPGAETLKDIGIKKLTQERDMQAAKLEAVNAKLAECEKNYAVLQHTAENPARLAIEYEAARKESAEAKRRYNAVVMAYDTIEGAGESLRRNITPRLREKAGNILSLLTGGRYTDLGIAPDFSCTVMTDSGTKDIALLSGGTRDAVYFSLRIALIDVLFGESVPPLILDEVCAQLDDVRMAAVIRMLGFFGENGMQSILFTSHTREEQAAGGGIVMNVNNI